MALASTRTYCRRHLGDLTRAKKLQRHGSNMGRTMEQPTESVGSHRRIAVSCSCRAEACLSATCGPSRCVRHRNRVDRCCDKCVAPLIPCEVGVALCRRRRPKCKSIRCLIPISGWKLIGSRTVMKYCRGGPANATAFSHPLGQASPETKLDTATTSSDVGGLPDRFLSPSDCHLGTKPRILPQVDVDLPSGRI